MTERSGSAVAVVALFAAALLVVLAGYFVARWP